jgi:hypothetical protein
MRCTVLDTFKVSKAYEVIALRSASLLELARWRQRWSCGRFPVGVVSYHFAHCI